MIQDGAVEIIRGDGWLIEKDSLYGFQEALVMVLHWEQ